MKFMFIGYCISGTYFSAIVPRKMRFVNAAASHEEKKQFKKQYKKL